MIILAIETSCDETAISILKSSGGLKNPTFEILSNIVASQVKIHSQWGGVVPSLAKREHQANLILVLTKSLKKAGVLKSKFQNPKIKQIPNSPPAIGFASGEWRAGKIQNSILNREPELAERLFEFLWEHQKPLVDLIAVTQGPGLEPALWTGINFAKALAIGWNKPLVAVNHMEGHIVASLLKSNLKNQISKITFPAIALLVSGGHTQLVLMKNFGDYKIIGETLDDAAGEAFDKVARMLGLGYPGGPQIARLAQSARKYAEQTQKNAEKKQSGLRYSASSLRKSARELKLPRPMINSKDFNFSFSGLKTAVLYKIKELTASKEVRPRGGAKRRDEVEPLNENLKAEIAASFQQAVIDVLISKTLRAAKTYQAKTIILGGGVAANKELRKQLKFSVKKELPDSLLLLPEIKFTGDNAAMIGAAAYFRAKKKEPACRQGRFANLSKLKADGNLKL